MARSKQITYSQALNELEKIVSEIESEEVDVDVLAEKVKRAAFLVKFCKGRLRGAEQEVKKVLEDVEEEKAVAESPAEEEIDGY